MNIAAQPTGHSNEAAHRIIASDSHESSSKQEHGNANLTTPRIREAISVLFAQGRHELAAAVGEAAISLYPYSEDILVMCSLLAEVQEDWERAEKLLVRLIELQEAAAPTACWLHLLRVLRCQGKFADATLVAEFCATRYPEDKLLCDEIASLRQVIAKV